MPKATRLWHLTVAAVALAVALSLCALVVGRVFSVLREPVMLLWLIISWAAFYLVGVSFCGRWRELLAILGGQRAAEVTDYVPPERGNATEELPSSDDGDIIRREVEESPEVVAIDLGGQVEIGQAFYHDGREESSLKPGILAFEGGVLHFRGEAEQAVDLAGGMQKLGDSYLCVIDDEVYDNPVYGKRDPVRVVRILSAQSLFDPVATFLMPLAPAKLTEAIVREYVEQRTSELEQTRDLLLRSVSEVIGQWSHHPQADVIIRAFIAKVDPKPFIDPACLMSFELRLRNKLLDGHLGNPLLWTSAFEVQWLDRGRAVSLDLLPAEARSFYYDSFRFLVRLLQRDCPLQRSYPELVNALASWLLLREAAVRHFADLMTKQLGDCTTQDLKALFLAYVGQFSEEEALQDENLVQLAYLLVGRGLLTAPAAFRELGYHEEHNILLILDTVKVNVGNALEEKRLDRFAEKLFV